VRKKEPICPLFKKECLGDGCMFWTHLLGTHPQTGQSIDQFDCSIKWLPMLLVENARHTRGAQAAVESMRNEVVQRQDALNNAVALGQRKAAQQIGEQEWNPERLQKPT
jgi:hypothetical protein